MLLLKTESVLRQERAAWMYAKAREVLEAGHLEAAVLYQHNAAAMYAKAYAACAAHRGATS